MSTTLAPEPTTTSGFSYRQRTFQLDDIAGMTHALHEDGFALVPGVLSLEEVQKTRTEIDRLRPFGFDVLGKTDHFKCVFNRHQHFLSLIDRPGVIDLAESAMGNDCHMIGQTAWRSHPGHDGWSPHTDRVFVEMPEDIAMDPRFKLPIYLCTAHYYLDDLTLDMAPTWVIPGSHRSGRALSWGKDPNPTWQGRELEPILCRAGDLLFFRSEIWHTGSKNTTADKSRYLLQVHYSHRWVAQQFSPYLAFQFNPEILAVANPRQRRLLGEHHRGAYD
jgi:ectoine hydroxylase-related dioxygenase (phytanoyl-CoA dioxygenase family)